jgi:sulfoxide reductase heme-binding subunit YedZ
VAGLPRFAVRAVHSSTALMALAFLAVHVLTLLADPYAQLRLVDLVLPFAGAYRPLWLGLGTLALDLTLALALATALRHRIGPRAWKAIHLGAYAAWPVAVLHALGTGTDAGTAWLLAVTAACVLLVAGATMLRLTPGFTVRTARVPEGLR